MKTKLAMLLVLGFGLLAQAGNDGPQAMPPQPPPSVLAEYVQSGGFMVPPGYPSSHIDQILVNGTAQRTTYFNSDAKPEVKKIKTLTAEELRELKNLVKEVQPGKIFDANPEQPECTDAPSSHMNIYQDSGKLQISAWFGCKTMSRENAGVVDGRIIQILIDLERLANKKK